ncbi:MAG: hypothetical protein U0414_16150 [Polyangiaceae bacterium]
MSTQRVRLNDPLVCVAAERLENFTWILARRLADYRSSGDRLDRTLAMMEASAAASLIESLLYEIALRLLVHGIRVDIEGDIASRLSAFSSAHDEFESLYGPIAQA